MVQSFAKSFWGYRCADVDRFIIKLSEEHQAGMESLEKQKADLEKTNRQLKEEFEVINAETVKYKEMEKAISDALVQSQIKSANIIKETESQIEDMKRAAEAEISAKKLELHNLRKQASHLRGEFEQLINKYKSYLDEATDMENENSFQEYDSGIA